MPTVEQEFEYLVAGINQLEVYLLSDELYSSLASGASDLSCLTLGGLLLTDASLQVRTGASESGASLIHLEQQLTRVRSKWLSTWERKAACEAHSRLDLWRNFLVDYHQSPEDYAGEYPQQVRGRVILNLLSEYLPPDSPVIEGLSTLDKVLKSSFVSGNFIWDSVLVTAFPPQDYWYLYGTMKSDERSIRSKNV